MQKVKPVKPVNIVSEDLLLSSLLELELLKDTPIADWGLAPERKQKDFYVLLAFLDRQFPDIASAWAIENRFSLLRVEKVNDALTELVMQRRQDHDQELDQEQRAQARARARQLELFTFPKNTPVSVVPELSVVPREFMQCILRDIDLKELRYLSIMASDLGMLSELQSRIVRLNVQLKTNLKFIKSKTTIFLSLLHELGECFLFQESWYKMVDSIKQDIEDPDNDEDLETIEAIQKLAEMVGFEIYKFFKKFLPEFCGRGLSLFETGYHFRCLATELFGDAALRNQFCTVLCLAELKKFDDRLEVLIEESVGTHRLSTIRLEDLPSANIMPAMFKVNYRVMAMSLYPIELALKCYASRINHFLIDDGSVSSAQLSYVDIIINRPSDVGFRLFASDPSAIQSLKKWCQRIRYLRKIQNDFFDLNSVELDSLYQVFNRYNFDLTPTQPNAVDAVYLIAVYAVARSFDLHPLYVLGKQDQPGCYEDRMLHVPAANNTSVTYQAP